MDNIKTIETAFVIFGSVSAITQIIVLIATIIIYTKNKNAASITLLIGSLLVFIGNLSSYFISFFFARQDVDYLIYIQLGINGFSALSYWVFGVGLLLYALNRVKKQNDILK
ncbi:MAG: hypothetical protein ACK5MZ_10410 [Aestuariibaculum sp.]